MTATDVLALLIVAGEWSGLARALFGQPIYAGVLDVLLMGLAIIIGVRAVRDGRAWASSIGLALVAAYMVLAAIQIFNPNVPEPLVGLEGFRKTAFTMLAVFIVAWQVRGNAGRFYGIVAIGSIPAFLWTTRQFIAPLPIEEAIISSSGVSTITFHAGSVLRAFAPTSGPFHMGILGASIMVIGVVLAHYRSRWWLVPAALGGWALGLSLTRANMIAGVIGLLAVIVLAGAWRERVRLGIVAVPAIASIALAAALAVGLVALPTLGLPTPSSAPSNVTATANPSVAATPTATVPPAVSNILDDRNLQLRFGYWRKFVGFIVERPIIGYGTSAAADGMSRHYVGTDSVRFEPHSLYLKPALELGVGGLILFLAILGWAFAAGWRLLRRERFVALVALGILVVTSVSGITGPMLDAYPFNLLFWATVGWLAWFSQRAPRPDAPT